MLNGYVTFQELMLITGYPNRVLKKLINAGLSRHELHIYEEEYNNYKSIERVLFDLDEVQKWITAHIF